MKRPARLGVRMHMKVMLEWHRYISERLHTNKYTLKSLFFESRSFRGFQHAKHDFMSSTNSSSTNNESFSPISIQSQIHNTLYFLLRPLPFPAPQSPWHPSPTHNTESNHDDSSPPTPSPRPFQPQHNTQSTTLSSKQ